MNKHERFKHERDGLDAREAVLRDAEYGRQALDEADLFRIKWLGFYEHNTKDGRFMLRTKIPQGILTGEQAQALAWIAGEHGQGLIDCTTRQCVQIHRITLQAMPAILAELERVGLTSVGACGDATHNVIGCPVAGIAHDELAEV